MAEMRGKLKVGVLGPGAIGGLLAGLFGKAGNDVYCIKKPGGLREDSRILIKSFAWGDFTAYPQVSTKLENPVDILFITVKAPFLKAALDAIPLKEVEKALVVLLLNGVGHRELVRARLGNRVVVGMIGSIEVVKIIPNTIQQLSRQIPQIDLASDNDVSESELRKLAEAIKTVGIPASVLKTEAEVIWKKLVRLGAIASLTAAFQEAVGVIRSDAEKRKHLEAMVYEGALVALKEGVKLNPTEVLQQIDALPENLTTSLQRDVRLKTPSEVEAITGGVIRLASLYDIPVPTYVYAYEQIMKRY